MSVLPKQSNSRIRARGTSMAEYALAGALVTLVGVMGLIATGSRLNDLLTGMTNQILQLSGIHNPLAAQSERTAPNRVEEIEIPSINVEAIEAALPDNYEIDRKNLPTALVNPSGKGQGGTNCGKDQAFCGQ